MTACPCAQQLVAGRARERLVDDGFTDDEIERIFDARPRRDAQPARPRHAAHRLPRGLRRPRSRRATLLEIVEDSMSSEIYELMKRSDEGAVVEKAHRRPRFVEDCVREMIGGVVERFGDLGDEHFVSARQENLETIHQHNVVAERFGAARRAAPRARDRRARRASHVDARVARRRRALSARLGVAESGRRLIGRLTPCEPPSVASPTKGASGREHPDATAVQVRVAAG